MNRLVQFAICIIAGILSGLAIIHQFFPEFFNNVGQLLMAALPSAVVLTALYYVLFKFILEKLGMISKRQKNILLAASIIMSIVIILSIPVNPYHVPTKQSMKIALTGDKDDKAESAEVWLLGIYADGKAIPFENIVINGEYAVLSNAIVFDSEKPTAIQWKGTALKETKITFLKQPFGGQFNLFWNGQKRSIDLYSEFDGEKNVVLTAKHKITWIGLMIIAGHMLLSFTLLLSAMLIFFLYCKFEGKTVRVSSKRLLIYALPCIIVWLIYLFAFYPGIMSQDSINQWTQAKTFRLDDSNPVFYTLIIWIVTKVWHSPASVALLQIFFMAFVFAYGMVWLERLGAPKWMLMGVTILFSLNPVNGFMINTLWRDIPYSILLLWSTIPVIAIIRTKGDWLNHTKSQILLTIVFISIVLLRHNGIAAIILLLLGILIFYKHQLKNVAKVFLISILIVSIVKGPVYDYLNVVSVRSWVYFTMPIQQLGAIAQENYSFSDKEKAVLDKIYPFELWGTNYNKFRISPITYDRRFNSDMLSKNKMEFMKVWASLVIRHPKAALDAYLSRTSIIWRIGYLAPEGIYTNPKTIVANTQKLKQESKLPAVKNILQEVNRFTLEPNIIWLLWRPAVYIYASILLGIIFMLRNGKKGLLVLAPSICNILSYLPVTSSPSTRYFYSAMIIMPILFVLSFMKLDKEEENVQSHVQIE